MRITLLILFLFTGNTLLSQDKPTFKERLFINPDIGLQFGTLTYIHVAPKVGYRFTEKFAGGFGGTYIYIDDKRYKAINLDFTSSIYGGSVFTQYQLFDAIRLYGEYEMLNIEFLNLNSLELHREWVPALLLGGGYTSRIDNNSSVGFMLLWDVIEHQNSIYRNPIIRIGFTFGL